MITLLVLQDVLKYVEFQHEILKQLNAFTDDSLIEYQKIYTALCHEIIKMKNSDPYMKPQPQVYAEGLKRKNNTVPTPDILKNSPYEIAFKKARCSSPVNFSNDFPSDEETDSDFETEDDDNEDDDMKEAFVEGRDFDIDGKVCDFLECDVCREKFLNVIDFVGHRVIHGDNTATNFKCSVCSRGFKTLPRLRRHFGTHYGLKPYKCRFCKKAFFDLLHFKEHYMRHGYGIKQFPCHICGLEFNAKVQRKRHFRDHHDLHLERTKCEIGDCQISFTKKKLLNKHMRKHQKNEKRRARHIYKGKWKKQKCNVCGLMFLVSFLDKHQRTHEQEHHPTAKQSTEHEHVPLHQAIKQQYATAKLPVKKEYQTGQQAKQQHINVRQATKQKHAIRPIPQPVKKDYETAQHPTKMRFPKSTKSGYVTVQQVSKHILNAQQATKQPINKGNETAQRITKQKHADTQQSIKKGYVGLTHQQIAKYISVQQATKKRNETVKPSTKLKIQPKPKCDTCGLVFGNFTVLCKHQTMHKFKR